MFLLLHNLLCDISPDQTAEDIYRAWITSPLLVINNVQYYVFHFIGDLPAGNNYSNVVNSAMKRLITCFVTRNRNAPIELTLLPTIQPVYPDEGNLYTIYLASETHANCDLFMSVLSEISDFIFDTSKCNPVCKVYEIVSTQNILNHYYVNEMLPTYHICKEVDPTNVTHTAEQFAATIGFCQLPAHHRNVIPEIPQEIRLLLPNAFLRGVHHPPQPVLPATRFDNEKHVYPNVEYYSPWSNPHSSLYYTIICGLTIESSLIDGFKVPMPNPAIALNADNSFLLNSAVPSNKINTVYGCTPAAKCPLLYPRTPRVPFTLNNSFTVRCTDITRLGYFTSRIVAPMPNVLPGLNIINGLNNPNMSSSKWSWRFHPNHFDNSRLTSFPQKIHGWSSYRYISTQFGSALEYTQHIYFIMNFRAIYGTNPLVTQSEHPFTMLPDLVI